MKNMEFGNSFYRMQKYRKYYEGYSELEFPYYDAFFTRNQYFMYSSGTSGTIRSPGFGKKFDAKKFKNKLDYKYKIWLLDNWYIISRKFPDLTLVLHFNVHVQLFGGREYVLLTEYNGNTEFFYNAGNVSIIRRYKAKDIKYWAYIMVEFERDVDQNNVDKMIGEKETGFSLDWYYEDGKGNKAYIEQDGRFIIHTRNKRFIQFMNLIYEAVTVHKISIDKIWDTVKKYRVEYIHK